MRRTPLTVGLPGDRHEQEADAVSRAAVAATAPDGGERGRVVDCAAERPVGDTAVPETVLNVVEPLLGTGLGHVRVRADADAKAAAASLDARAFTLGNEIWLGLGASRADVGLMAHEMTHIVQQRGDGRAEAARLRIQREERSKAQTPAAEQVAGLRVGGAIDSKKIVRVGWTFDDGPTKLVTSQMEKTTQGTPSTWYVMRNQVESGDRKKNLAALKRKQDLGQEIGIHSMHPTESHVTWFPGARSSYNDVRSAMKDLRDFHALLSGAGVRVKFVRMPFGLYTELMEYLRLLGMHDESLRKRVARDIIAGRPIPPISQNVAEAYKVKEDFEFVKSELTKLGLHEWGGAGAETPEIGAQSWEAESDPPGGGLSDDLIGTFKTTVGRTARDSQPRSLVILAHDTRIRDEQMPAGKTAARVIKVGQDIMQMEKYAFDKGVRIEYLRMSDLYRVVRGQEP
jgi:hypothetical protein